MLIYFIFCQIFTFSTLLEISWTKSLILQWFFGFCNETVALPLHHRYRYMNEPDIFPDTDVIDLASFQKIKNSIWKSQFFWVTVAL